MREQIALFGCVLLFCSLTAQVKKAPDRQEGEGPWNQLIIRGLIQPGF